MHAASLLGCITSGFMLMQPLGRARCCAGGVGLEGQCVRVQGEEQQDRAERSVYWQGWCVWQSREGRGRTGLGTVWGLGHVCGCQGG